MLHLPLKRGIKFLKKAMDEETKEYSFRIYLAAYPNMTKENFKSFNEFWEEVKPENIVVDSRSEEEIMQEIIEIENKFVKGGN